MEYKLCVFSDIFFIVDNNIILFNLQSNNSQNKVTNNIESGNIDNTKSEVHVGSLGLGTALAVAYDLCSENMNLQNQVNITSAYSQNLQVSGFVSLSTMKSPNNNCITSNFPCSSIVLNGPNNLPQSHSYLTPITSGFFSPQKPSAKISTNLYLNTNMISLPKVSNFSQVVNPINCVSNNNYKYSYTCNYDNKVVDGSLNNTVVGSLPVLTSNSVFTDATSNDFISNPNLAPNTSFSLSNETPINANMFSVILNENGGNYYNASRMSINVTNATTTAISTNGINNKTDSLYITNSNALVPSSSNPSEGNTKSSSESPPNSTDESMYELSDEEIREIDRKV